MGSLVDFRDFETTIQRGWGHARDGHLSPRWYFSNYKSGQTSAIDVRTDFPHRLGIHRDKAEEIGTSLFPQIRRFVERQCVGCVLVRYEDMTYEYLYETTWKKGWDKFQRSKVVHGYHVFYFEESGDAVLFALMFSEPVTTIAPRHPRYLDVPEEQIEHAIREPHRGH